MDARMRETGHGGGGGRGGGRLASVQLRLFTLTLTARRSCGVKTNNALDVG